MRNLRMAAMLFGLALAGCASAPTLDSTAPPASVPGMVPTLGMVPLVFVGGHIVGTPEGQDPETPEYGPGVHGDPAPPTGYFDRVYREAWFLDRYDEVALPPFSTFRALAIVPGFMVEDPWTLQCCGYADLHIQTEDWSTLVISVGRGHALLVDMHLWESDGTPNIAVDSQVMNDGDGKILPVDFAWVNPESGVAYRYLGNVSIEVEWWTPENLHRVNGNGNVYELGGKIPNSVFFDWKLMGERGLL